MRSAVDLIHRSMRLGAVRPGRGAAVSIDVVVTVQDQEHVVTFSRDVDGRKRGTWATAEPAQFVASGYYRMVAAVVHSLASDTGHDLVFYQNVLQSLHGYVAAVADDALAAYDATRVAA